MMSLTEPSPPPPPQPLPLLLPLKSPLPLPLQPPSSKDSDDGDISKNQTEKEKDNNDDIISKLPKTRGFLNGPTSTLTLYQGFWYPSMVVPNVIAFQTHFEAQDQDILVAAYPKSGTTWLKALTFSIVNRAKYTPSETPLLSKNPHELVPFAEFILYAGAKCPDPDPNPNPNPDPRLYATHMPYSSLPECIQRKDSKSRIIYVCRDPRDVVVSSWHFATTNSGWTMEEYIDDKFCKGETGFGPYWAHVLGFWKASLENPEKVLFLRYEEIKRDTATQVKKIAEFVGLPFPPEEESRGAVEEIVALCSLGSLKELEVNKTGKFSPNFKNKSYFRKGEIGDWVNHLTPSLAQSISDMVAEKVNASGLTYHTIEDVKP